MSKKLKQRSTNKAKQMLSIDGCKQTFKDISKPIPMVPIVFQKATSEQIIKFDLESTTLICGTKNKPDFGLAMLKTFGVKIINQSISGHCVCYAHEKSPVNKEIYVNASFCLENRAATIFLTKKTFSEWLSERGNLFIKLIPCIQDRYLNPAGTDWVIPMYEFREGIDSIEEGAINAI